MRCARLLATALLGMLLCALPSSYLTGPVVQAAKAKTEKKEVRVWVNTNSSVYHCPGTRWILKSQIRVGSSSSSIFQQQKSAR